MSSKITGAAWVVAMIASVGFATAQAAGPSFDCARASTPDERTICTHKRLAALDRAASTAFSQASQKFRQEARKIAVESLAARRACGANPLCILDQQVQAIGEYSDLGSTVPVPPWVGAYRYEIFNARGGPRTVQLPGRVGQCTTTQISEISTRFGGELKKPDNELDSSGSAVTYANRGYQVSYGFVQALADSHIGDRVLLCLVSIPTNCPPGENRGRMYSATNLRTKGSWLLPDAQHSCGGA
jgi:uncharacterized protein